MSRRKHTVYTFCARAKSAHCRQCQMATQWRLFNSALTCYCLSVKQQSVSLCNSRCTIGAPDVALTHQQVNTIRNWQAFFSKSVWKAWKLDHRERKGAEREEHQNYIEQSRVRGKDWMEGDRKFKKTRWSGIKNADTTINHKHAKILFFYILN